MEKTRYDSAVNDKCELRPAVPSDENFIFALEKTCMEGYAKALWPDLIWPASRGLFAHQNFQIISINQRNAGCVEMSTEDGGRFLESLYLLPDFQGQGFGAAVLGKIKQECARSQTQLRLSVLTSNKRAKAFYLREGFRIYKETPERFFMEAI